MHAIGSVRLADVAGGRDNNLNLIRMIAATGVLVSHAFPIALGPSATQPFEAATGYTLGWICVAMFFAISGFLIARSFDRTPDVESWASARIMRLFPALIVVLALTVLLYGPLFTRWAADDYFRQAATYTYIPRNLSLAFLQPGLPGVIADNPYPQAINGSLWTLVHEVTCYLGVLAVGLAGALASGKRFALVCATYVAAYAATGIPEVADNIPARFVALRDLSYPFFLGTAWYVWRDRLPLSWPIALVVCVLAFAAHGTPLFEPLFVGAIAYCTFILAYRPGGFMRSYNRLGDYSYGVYVYAFPLQQAAVAMAGPMDPLTNMAIAFPLTLGCAVVSWHWVEKPALDRRHAVAAAMVRWRKGSSRHHARYDVRPNS